MGKRGKTTMMEILLSNDEAKAVNFRAALHPYNHAASEANK
jgi:hypothetical protein